MQAQLNREKQTIAELKQVYAQAAKDVEKRIRELSMRTDMENLQTIIYQKQYQEVLKKQIDNVLDSLHTQEFATIESFLTNCYTDGYLGVMYDIAGQGIPIIMPIDPKQVVKALQTDSKISTKLYTRLGEDVKKLKASIRAELSRGITQGASYNQIAVKIAKGMKSDYNTAYNSAVRIARTEGHRIQCQSAYDAQKAAVSKGADVVKQWNSVLDGRTRPHHRQLDGQIRELDEPFEIGTLTADYPGAFGRASEDCNCRCALLQRARWALDDDELETLKERAAFHDLDKTKDFEDYQKKYLKASEQVRDSGQKKNDEDTLENLEKQFSDLTEGYSYDDFINDFGTIEDGFEGSSDAEIAKAKKLSEKIKSLRSELNTGKASVDNTIHTKQESIKILQNLGIDFKDNSSGSISDETLSNFADFITDFESSHKEYFNRNKLQLKSITIVDDLIENGKTVGGAYYSDSQSIRLMKKAIETKPTSKLITYSKSDDYRMHFLAHEYGHYIADSLDKNLSITDYDVVQNALLRYFENDIFKTKTSNLVDALGSYGSKNAREAFAEAFAEAYTSKEPRKFARIFKEELEKVIEKNGKSSIIKSGAVSGARNPFSDEADAHAKKYYGLVRSMKTDVAKIAKATGMAKEEVQAVKNFIFLEKHDLGGKELEYFKPDFMMAQSWQRLTEGNPEPHDITMLKHEVLERKLMAEGLSQEEAHLKASKEYNYSKEAGEYYAKIEKHKKE